MRRATYAVRTSAAARTIQRELDNGGVRSGSDSYNLYQQAQSWVHAARHHAKSGNHDGAARAARYAKEDMAEAVQAAKAEAQKAAERRLRAKATNERIDEALRTVNPRWERGVHDYTHNCSNVVQAHELQRRGQDVEAGPRTGVSLAVMEATWGSKYIRTAAHKDGGQSEVERAFAAPGTRGIVYVAWNNGGAHVFNVENVEGTVRFVDGQPTPIVTDAAHYFSYSKNCSYMRVDHLATPSDGAMAMYLKR